MAKISISLPDPLLATLDGEAREAGVSRSELIQQATSAYLGKSAEEREAERMRQRKERVFALLDEMRARPARDQRPTLEILREIRATDDSAPLRCDESSTHPSG